MDINKHIISRLEDIGSARTLLSEILKNDLFDNLSKHNPYWDSEDSLSDEKLYDIRMNLGAMEDKLMEIYIKLKLEDDE